MEETLKNPLDLRLNDIVTAYNKGVHQIIEMTESEDGKINVKYNQVYTLDGTKVSINRPAVCDISFCKPAYLMIPELEQRVAALQELINYLKPLRFQYNG